MGGFGCRCGSSIDDNTDYLPYKAHLIADQDLEDFADAVGAKQFDAFDLIKARVYQCASCSRLIFVSKDGQHSFAPEKESAGFLGSVNGEGWRRVLRGQWSDSERSGWVYWGDSGIKDGDNGSASLKTLEEVEKLYYEVFYRLSSAGKLRSAVLRVIKVAQKAEILHDWGYVPEWK